MSFLGTSFKVMKLVVFLFQLSSKSGEKLAFKHLAKVSLQK